jgi:hypothetical protein
LVVVFPCWLFLSTDGFRPLCSATFGEFCCCCFTDFERPFSAAVVVLTEDLVAVAELCGGFGAVPFRTVAATAEFAESADFFSFGGLPVLARNYYIEKHFHYATI